VHLASGQVNQIPESCGWWGTAAAQESLRSFAPDLVLVIAGNNEVYDRSAPAWDGIRAPGDPVFDTYILDEYVSAVDALGATGATVVWTVPPCADYSRTANFIEPAEGNRRVDHFADVLVPSLAARRPVVVADLKGQICPGGNFVDTVLGIIDARGDGLHLTSVAADAVVDQWLGPLLLAARP
jgi:hypothetical protein